MRVSLVVWSACVCGGELGFKQWAEVRFSLFGGRNKRCENEVFAREGGGTYVHV